MKRKEKQEQQPLTEEQMEKEKRSNYHFFACILMVFLSIIAFRVYWNRTFVGVEVDGSSMQQTLQDGEKLLMRRMNDRVTLNHGDVIVVDVSDYEECGDVDFLIKRLIAMEGDKVKCEDGQVYVWYYNTEGYVPLDEPYAYYQYDKADYDFAEYTVRSGEIFFLGDNRYNSLDSRYKEDKSHLEGLYKEADVFGVVPQWAISHQSILEKIFF